MPWKHLTVHIVLDTAVTLQLLWSNSGLDTDASCGSVWTVSCVQTDVFLALSFAQCMAWTPPPPPPLLSVTW